MKQIRIAPIVEGHGEVVAVRTLLERVWREVAGGEHADILKPIRQHRSKLLRLDPATRQWVPDPKELARANQLAERKLTERRNPPLPNLILLLIDADKDCPKILAKSILEVLRKSTRESNVAVVLPCPEYETWFVAAAPSLAHTLGNQPINNEPCNDVDALGLGKSWIKERIPGYSETVDQVKLTAEMDLAMCRAKSPSFDKLCRELECCRRMGSQES